MLSVIMLKVKASSLILTMHIVFAMETDFEIFEVENCDTIDCMILNICQINTTWQTKL
jgi:hypothetical protein